MSDKFFITGLPRSRTAWFSAFMTASGFPCEHELINNCETIEEYKEKVKDLSDSNTAFAFVGNPYPERKTLVIHRDDAPHKEFLINLDGISGLHVNFNDIHNRIEEIFFYLTSSPLNTKVYNKFKMLNITTMEEMNNEAAMRLYDATNK
tara:strand:+ start:1157 stop:1603 length:447 start_codon:yes stop_codon:yes gene_type:complete